jgi:hypothetical protein
VTPVFSWLCYGAFFTLIHHSHINLDHWLYEPEDKFFKYERIMPQKFKCDASSLSSALDD